VKRVGLHVFLFLGTCVTTFSCYRFYFGASPSEAAVFAACALAILGSHEMGHWVMARYHGVDTSLPYFIPVPIGFGTFGAVIRLRGKIPTRDALVDIGAAGPLAGLAVAVPVLVAGMVTARPLDVHPGELTFPGRMSLVSVVHGAWTWLTTGHEPVFNNGMEFGNNLLSLVLQRAMYADAEVHASPLLVAAWFGMLVTMLNLMPVGQLDGGHLTHAWLGPRAVPLGKALAVGMAFLAMFWSLGWLVWLLLTTRVVGFKHPAVERPEQPMSRGRKIVCLVSALCFVLTFMPVPATVW
jgi:membrane-associated protease RseP (regulator of RpoE activity)